MDFKLSWATEFKSDLKLIQTVIFTLDFGFSYTIYSILSGILCSRQSPAMEVPINIAIRYPQKIQACLLRIGELLNIAPVGHRGVIWYLVGGWGREAAVLTTLLCWDRSSEWGLPGSVFKTKASHFGVKVLGSLAPSQSIEMVMVTVLHIFRTTQRTSCPDWEKSMGHVSWLRVLKQQKW